MSIEFDVSQAKNADEFTKLMIFGYIRKLNNRHKISDNIPDLICFMIILYCMKMEYFDKIGKNTMISDDKLTITRI